jgi:hypothetical protein
MIADPGKIDELAIHIQAQNAPRGRVKSRRFSRADTLAQALPLISAHRRDLGRARRHCLPISR